jgi:hypothetical protein
MQLERRGMMGDGGCTDMLTSKERQMFMDRYSVNPYLQFVGPFYSDKDPAHNFRHIDALSAG